MLTRVVDGAACAVAVQPTAAAARPVTRPATSMPRRDRRPENCSSGCDGRRDIFHHGVATRVTTLVVRAANGGVANGDSLAPSISADGRRVAYSSVATDLVSRDANGTITDVFVTDIDEAPGAQNRLVSISSAGAAANGASAFPALSANGLVTAYHSAATNLVAGDSNATLDVFARTS
jgi:hypothetical protein